MHGVRTMLHATAPTWCCCALLLFWLQRTQWARHGSPWDHIIVLANHDVVFKEEDVAPAAVEPVQRPVRPPPPPAAAAAAAAAAALRAQAEAQVAQQRQQQQQQQRQVHAQQPAVKQEAAPGGAQRAQSTADAVRWAAGGGAAALPPIPGMPLPPPFGVGMEAMAALMPPPFLPGELRPAARSVRAATTSVTRAEVLVVPQALGLTPALRGARTPSPIPRHIAAAVAAHMWLAWGRGWMWTWCLGREACPEAAACRLIAAAMARRRAISIADTSVGLHPPTTTVARHRPTGEHRLGREHPCAPCQLTAPSRPSRTGMAHRRHSAATMNALRRLGGLPMAHAGSMPPPTASTGSGEWLHDVLQRLLCHRLTTPRPCVAGCWGGRAPDHPRSESQHAAARAIVAETHGEAVCGVWPQRLCARRVALRLSSRVAMFVQAALPQSA